MNTANTTQKLKLDFRIGSFKPVLRDAIIATLISAVIAVSINFVHPRAIPLIAEKDYEILVPCPEPGGEVIPIDAAQARLEAQDTFFVDARLKKQFDDWHLGGAKNLTYDYLDPTPPELIQDLAKAIARSRAQKVVVYGDGDLPDSGEQLGKEISGHGIKNVHWVRGGAPTLKRSLEETGE